MCDFAIFLKKTNLESLPSFGRGGGSQNGTGKKQERSHSAQFGFALILRRSPQNIYTWT